MKTEQIISRAAQQIAGEAWAEQRGTLQERLAATIAWKNLGTDGLTHEDREALRLLLDAATGVSSDLMDSDTADKLREATVGEAVESALARPEGHILVDGRRCYVEL